MSFSKHVTSDRFYEARRKTLLLSRSFLACRPNQILLHDGSRARSSSSSSSLEPGQIPSELGELTALQSLDLSANNLEGLFPRGVAVGPCCRPVSIHWFSSRWFLSWCCVVAAVVADNSNPRFWDSISQQTQRARFSRNDSLKGCSRTGGALPDNITCPLAAGGVFSYLLAAPGTGPIPPELGELSALTELTVGRNRLVGTAPS